MPGRETEAIQRAVEHYVQGASVLAAARAENVSPRALHTALDRRGIEKRGPIKGPAHHAWVDGRKASR